MYVATALPPLYCFIGGLFVIFLFFLSARRVRGERGSRICERKKRRRNLLEFKGNGAGQCGVLGKKVSKGI